MVNVRYILTKGSRQAQVAYEGADPFRGRIAVSGDIALALDFRSFEDDPQVSLRDIMGQVPPMASKRGIECRAEGLSPALISQAFCDE